MENKYIKGVGMTKFGNSSKPEHMMAFDAIKEALDDADMKMKEIDAVAVANLEFYFHGNLQRHMASLMSGLLKTRVPIVRAPAACGSSGAAFWMANQWQEFDNVLVVGMEKLKSNHTYHITEEFMMAAENVWEQQEGVNFPATNALVAQEYFQKFPDATMDDLSLISYKNHQNALRNPKAAFYNKPVSLDKIKASPVVTSPLRLFDCSTSVDGAAAAILSKDKTDVQVTGSGLCTDYLGPFERDHASTWDCTVNSANDAFKMAGIDRSDISVAELHDAFTIVELISYEDLGFAKKGEGAKLIRDGTVEFEGKLPINVSGGLKAKGHPISATGAAQIYEITKQLRDQCGDRQVSNPKYGLTHNVGGAGGSISTHIFKKL